MSSDINSISRLVEQMGILSQRIHDFSFVTGDTGKRLLRADDGSDNVVTIDLVPPQYSVVQVIRKQVLDIGELCDKYEMSLTVRRSGAKFSLIYATGGVFVFDPQQQRKVLDELGVEWDESRSDPFIWERDENGDPYLQYKGALKCIGFKYTAEGPNINAVADYVHKSLVFTRFYLGDMQKEERRMGDVLYSVQNQRSPMSKQDTERLLELFQVPYQWALQSLAQ